MQRDCSMTSQKNGASTLFFDFVVHVKDVRSGEFRSQLGLIKRILSLNGGTGIDRDTA